MNASNSMVAKLAFVAALATTAVTFTATAAPARADSFPSATVKHGDLNLSSDSGVRALNGRIRRAAHLLCVTPGTLSTDQIAAGRTCVRQTIANAAPKVRQAIARHNEERVAARALDGAANQSQPVKGSSDA